MTKEGRWCRDHDGCVVCGRNTTKHMGRGLCSTCYTKDKRERCPWYIAECNRRQMERYQRNRSQGMRQKREYVIPAKWARYYDACQSCGRVDRRHVGLGLCVACHSRRRYMDSKDQRLGFHRPFDDVEPVAEPYKAIRRVICDLGEVKAEADLLGYHWEDGELVADVVMKASGLKIALPKAFVEERC